MRSWEESQPRIQAVSARAVAACVTPVFPLRLLHSCKSKTSKIACHNLVASVSLTKDGSPVCRAESQLGLDGGRRFNHCFQLWLLQEATVAPHGSSVPPHECLQCVANHSESAEGLKAPAAVPSTPGCWSGHSSPMLPSGRSLCVFREDLADANVF